MPIFDPGVDDDTLLYPKEIAKRLGVKIKDVTTAIREFGLGDGGATMGKPIATTREVAEALIRSKHPASNAIRQRGEQHDEK